ncbi:uncharacterized protein [Chelonus insularis]|uniref:uncharacterized protein n=1 Tax=Chelonus insularis TaxID=460826 RepID=UPI00158E93AF|nr:uncharacterized protein LOC118071879 [Chelonus insularis]
MSNKSLSLIADDYFYNLNSLTKRISEDIKATKDAYEGLWGSLSLTEKNQAINETIIQPEVALKYSLSNVDESINILSNFYPKMRDQTGMKYIIDETGHILKWRDEHSSPFSFMTKSQINLHNDEYADNSNSQMINNYEGNSLHFMSPIKINENCSFECSLNEYSPTSTQVSFYQSESFTDSVCSNVDSNRVMNSTTNNDNAGNIFTKFMYKTSLLKMTNNSDDDIQSLVPQKNISIKHENKSNTDNRKNHINIINSITLNPKSDERQESTALIETPSSYDSFQFSKSNQEDTIPKTGFEFLDNW